MFHERNFDREARHRAGGSRVGGGRRVGPPGRIAGDGPGAQGGGPDAPGVEPKGKTLTTDTGKPVGDNRDSMTAGPSGPTLLEDFHLLEKIARFDRERIPERVVHARGVGVHGEFVSYADHSAKLTKRGLPRRPRRTRSRPVFARFSTVVLPKGSADTARDVRGFSVKFYTEEGNYDLVGNDIPVFFIRDAIKFPDLVHSLKPSPVSNVQESERFFDFFSATPESTHMLTFLLLGPWHPRQLPRNGRVRRPRLQVGQRRGEGPLRQVPLEVGPGGAST